MDGLRAYVVSIDEGRFDPSPTGAYKHDGEWVDVPRTLVARIYVTGVRVEDSDADLRV